MYDTPLGSWFTGLRLRLLFGFSPAISTSAILSFDFPRLCLWVAWLRTIEPRLRVNDGLGQDGKYLQHISPLLAMFLYMGFLFLIRRIIFDLVALDMSLLWRVSSAVSLFSASTWHEWMGSEALYE